MALPRRRTRMRHCESWRSFQKSRRSTTSLSSSDTWRISVTRTSCRLRTQPRAMQKLRSPFCSCRATLPNVPQLERISWHASAATCMGAASSGTGGCMAASVLV